MKRLVMRWLGRGSVAFLLAGCHNPFGDVDTCALLPNQQTDAATLVQDPIVGEHQGQLTWIETGATTDFTFTVGFDGPAIKTEGCAGPYQVTVRYEAASGDGLIEASSDEKQYLDPALHLPDQSVSFGLDPTSLLAAGIAPAEPDLAQQNPSLTLELDRDTSSWTKGTVRAVTKDQQVTVGVITFGGGS